MDVQTANISGAPSIKFKRGNTEEWLSYSLYIFTNGKLQ